VNEYRRAEINSLLTELSPADREEVLRFMLARLAQRKADLKPITAQEWERIPRWRRKVIYWRARWYAFLNGLRTPKRAG